MKRKLFLALLLIVCSCVPTAIAAETTNNAAATVTGPYNPAITYPGIYISESLLFKNRPTSQSWQAIPMLNTLKKVTCADAMTSLQREGKWQGNLNLDGSCGSTYEPAEWILGNRLNYEEARQQSSR